MCACEQLKRALRHAVEVVDLSLDMEPAQAQDLLVEILVELEELAA